EQQRDSFIFYIRDRLSGLGGSWQRRQRADVERYPAFMKESYEASLKKESVDDIRGLPKAIGDIGYPDASEVKAECSDFRAALDDIPPERVRLHVCWGNYEGPHDLDVELDKIIPFLRRAKVGGFVLPFANPRHAHEYRYLKDLIGEDQIIVAGVIDSTTNFVEHPEVIAERLENVTETIGDPHRVMAGSDCGFETIPR